MDGSNVVYMDSRAKKNAKPTRADIEAAARLRAIWQAIPRDRRPTQEQIAEQWPEDEEGNKASQGLVSQYLNGRIKLNYMAVIYFSRALGCRPEEIRDDLPEMQARECHVWPFKFFSRDRYMALTETERGMIEWAIVNALEKIEATQPPHAAPAKPPGRSVLQRRSS